MRLILAFFLALTLCGQEAPKAAAPQAGLGVRLMEAAGMREKMPALLDASMEAGKESIRKMCPDCPAEFAEEWTRRMKMRIKMDMLLEAAGRVYEKEFSREELEGLLAAVMARREGRTVELSEELKKKWADQAPAVMGGVTGAFTEIGARLGMEVEAELEKEHPEWSKKMKKE